jgi:hypothetical protein
MHRLLTSWVVLVQLLGSVVAVPSNYINPPDVDGIDLAAENKRLLELQGQAADGFRDFVSSYDHSGHGRCTKDKASIRKEW